MRKKHKLDYLIEMEKAITEWMATAPVLPLCFVGPPLKNAIAPRVAKVFPMSGGEVFVVVGSERGVVVSQRFAAESLFKGGFTTMLESFEPIRTARDDVTATKNGA